MIELHDQAGNCIIAPHGARECDHGISMLEDCRTCAVHYQAAQKLQEEPCPV